MTDINSNQEGDGTMILNYIAGPLIGAVIGYCTNYIAVKMLFYPRKEKRIFGRRLPFTPGAIPKGKPRLAAAVGDIVSRKLLTEDDIASQLLSAQNEKKIVSYITGFMEAGLKQNMLLAAGGNEQVYLDTREKVSDALCGKVMDSLENVQLGALFAEKGGELIKEKTRGTMLEMFLSDDAVNAITSRGGQEIEHFVETEGRAYVKQVVDRELENLENSSPAELLEKISISREKQDEFISSAYHKLIVSGVKNTIENMDISHIIEEKINDMEVDELEDMVMAVMKKELNTIVNLGALIGCLIGILNIFL